jgi:hypothetical protein
MDQATQAALAKELERKALEKRVGQMTESELIQLVTKACLQALDTYNTKEINLTRTLAMGG